MAKKKNIGYKVFYLAEDGKLYPPMVANEDRKPTRTGVWLKAYAPPPIDKKEVDKQFAHIPEWLRHYHVDGGGRGTHAGRIRLAYRPGWHLASVPYATQFNKLDKRTGKKEIFPKELVWAECEYAADPKKSMQYQIECDARMMHDFKGRPTKRPQHSAGGINRIPVDGFYKYRTNPDPNSVEWIITGAIKVNKILTKAEVDRLVRAAGKTPQKVG